MSEHRSSEETQTSRRGSLYPAIQRQGGVANSLDGDVKTFIRVLWNHQEEQQLGPIALDYLEKRLGWSPSRFVKVLQMARAGEIEGVFESSPGRLAYTWELTEEDLRRCEARVAELRREREARRRSRRSSS